MSYTTSRSRHQQGQRCQRKRYWGYEWQGTGLSTTAGYLRAQLGIVIHQNLARLFEGMTKDEAAGLAKKEMHDWMTTRELESWEFNPSRTNQEHEFFVEVVGLTVLPFIVQTIREKYNVLSVEGEHRVPLLDDVEWYSREDGVLEDKSTKELSIFSFKTCQTYQAWKHLKGAERAMQNVSEPWALNQATGQKASYVAMLWLEVGALKANKYDGCYERDSPFCRPYTDGKKFYWQYRWEGGQVPRGAKKEPVWDLEIHSTTWADDILRNRVEPGNYASLLREEFKGPIPFPFAKERKDSWLRQVQAGEYKTRLGAKAVQEALDSGDVETWKRRLDLYFPQTESECPDCAFEALCWDGDKGLVQIGTTFKPREKRMKVETIEEVE